MISRRFSPRARNFPRVFATLFFPPLLSFFFPFLSLSLFFISRFISRRALSLVSRNFESNRPRDAERWLDAREIREIRRCCFMLNAESRKYVKKKGGVGEKKPTGSTSDRCLLCLIALGYFEHEWNDARYDARNNEKYQHHLARCISILISYLRFVQL